MGHRSPDGLHAEAARSAAVLAGRLRQLRDSAGLTQRALAQNLHISDSSLSRYLAGQSLPPWEVVATLCELTDTDSDQARGEWNAATAARQQWRWHRDRDNAALDGGPSETDDDCVTAVTAVTAVTDEPTTSAPPVPAAVEQGPGVVPPTVVPPAAVGRPLPTVTWDPALPAQAHRFGAPAPWQRAAVAIAVVGLMAITGLSVHLLFGKGQSVGASILPDRAPGPPVPTGTPTTAPTAVRSASSAASPGTSPIALPPAVPVASSTPAPPVRANPTKPSPSPSRSTPPPSGPVNTTIALTNGDPGTDNLPYVADVENWSQEPGAQVHLWTWRDDGEYRNQLWLLEKPYPDRLRFRNAYSGLCLDRNSDSLATVVQSPCGDSAYQQWTLDSGRRLRSLADRQCLQIHDRLRSQGSRLTVADCDGGWYQQWGLQPRPLQP